MRKTYTGISFLILATFIYASFNIVARLIGGKIPLLFQTWTRYLLASIVCFALVILTRSWKSIRNEDRKWLIARAGASILSIVTFFVSVINLPIGTVYFIFYAGSTIGGYIIGNILFQEKLNKVKVISLALSILGLLLIYSFNLGDRNIIFSATALISGSATSIYNTFSKKLSAKYSVSQLAFIDNFLSVFIGVFASIFLREQWILPTVSTEWIANGIFALMWVATSYLIIYGFARLEAQFGSLILLMEVLFGILFGFFLYQEVISASALLGGVMILGAIIIPEINLKNILKKFLL